MSSDIATETIGGHLVVSPKGDLDLATAPTLHTWTHRHIDQGAERMVLDLSSVDFLDSTALRVLVSIQKRLLGPRTRFVVVCPQRRLRRIFELTALDRLMTITDSVSTAIVTLDAE
jgi:anti-sigma B factor antagonist